MNKIEKVNEELITQVSFGCVNGVLSALAKGADVNYRSRIIGWTPLMIAVYGVYLELVQILLNRGANIHDVDNGNSMSRFAEVALYRAKLIRDIISKEIIIKEVKNHEMA